MGCDSVLSQVVVAAQASRWRIVNLGRCFQGTGSAAERGTLVGTTFPFRVNTCFVLSTRIG